jgi:hypothetical protein
MSAFAASSCCWRKKRSIVNGGGWNCPHCGMRSTRHWNVERHIFRSHGGLGEPINGFGKTREQFKTDTNLQFRHGYYYNSHKWPPFLPVQLKEHGFHGGTLKDGMRNDNDNDNDNKSQWDFMDKIIQPVKKALEFTRMLEELSLSNQRLSHYYYPSPISHQYPVYLSSLISGRSNIGSANPINNNSTSSMTKKIIDNEITGAEVTKRQLVEYGARLLQSIISSRPIHWWEYNQRNPPTNAVRTSQ